MIRKLIKLSLWLLIGIAALLVYRIAFSSPALVEQVYSRGIYPVLSQIWGTVTGLVSFSVGEILLYLFALSLLFFVVFIISALFKPSGKKLYSFLRRMISLLIIVFTLFAAFVFNWGLNYAREPLATSMGLDARPSTPQELVEVCVKLAVRANELRDQVQEDENGVFQLSSSREEILQSVSDVYDAYAPDYMNLGVKSRVKGVATPNLLSSITTSGIFSPFTFEANVNMQMPDLYFTSTVAHEYAHLKGFAREDEANFIAWYVTRNCDDTDFSYSGTALALVYAMNSLHDLSPELHSQLYYQLHPGILRDWEADGDYWDQFRTEFAEQATEVYSNYLVYNGTTDGTKSYGRMLDLILALNRAGEL